MSSSELVLVTGASGFLATHIVKQLLEQGYKVRGTVRSLGNEKKVAPLMGLTENAKDDLELVEADLLDEGSWAEAVKACTIVLHTASPFPEEVPRDERVLIEPAVNGTLNVLRACVLPGMVVKRVVLTSSIAAIQDLHNMPVGTLLTENDWPETSKLSPYPKSKTLAEKAAWDFIEERRTQGLPCFELAVINPGVIMGPVLHDTEFTSMLVPKKLMRREVPMLPNVYFATCDVRDVALAHIQAMLLPEAVNKRHIITCSVDDAHFHDCALILDAEFKSKGYKIPTTIAPDCLIKFMGLFDKSVGVIKPNLGKKFRCDNSRMVNVLKVEPTPLHKTLVDMAYSMIDKGIIKKKF